MQCLTIVVLNRSAFSQDLCCGLQNSFFFITLTFTILLKLKFFKVVYVNTKNTYHYCSFIAAKASQVCRFWNFLKITLSESYLAVLYLRKKGNVLLSSVTKILIFDQTEICVKVALRTKDCFLHHSLVSIDLRALVFQFFEVLIYIWNANGRVSIRLYYH